LSLIFSHKSLGISNVKNILDDIFDMHTVYTQYVWHCTYSSYVAQLNLECDDIDSGCKVMLQGQFTVLKVTATVCQVAGHYGTMTETMPSWGRGGTAAVAAVEGEAAA